MAGLYIMHTRVGQHGLGVADVALRSNRQLIVDLKQYGGVEQTVAPPDRKQNTRRERPVVRNDDSDDRRWRPWQ